MKPVIEFLEKNGFKKVKNRTYSNGKCSVVFLPYTYEIINNKNDSAYSNDLSIYWLIGMLTYYGHMNKNYIQ